MTSYSRPASTASIFVVDVKRGARTHASRTISMSEDITPLAISQSLIAAMQSFHRASEAAVYVRWRADHTGSSGRHGKATDRVAPAWPTTTDIGSVGLTR